MWALPPHPLLPDVVLRCKDVGGRCPPRPPLGFHSLALARRSGALLHLVDLVGEEAVGLAVDRGGRFGVGGVDQAKPSPPVLIEPVSHVLDAVLALNIEVPAMRRSDRFRGRGRRDPGR